MGIAMMQVDGVAKMAEREMMFSGMVIMRMSIVVVLLVCV